MVKNKYILYIVITVVLITIIYLSTDNQLVSENQTAIEYDFIQDKVPISNTDIESINKILSEKVYINPYKENSTFAYLIIIDKDKLDVEQIELSNIKGDINKLEIPSNKDFILSFRMFVPIPYKWHMESNDTNKVIILEDMTRIECKLRKEELRKQEWEKPFVLGSRQNFYFKSLKKGKQIVSFKYLPNKPGVVKSMIKGLDIEINIY